MKVLATTIVILAALAAFYIVSYPSASIRYELTIDAIVDGKSVSGSGVVEASYHTFPQFLGASSGGSAEISGEAIQIDLEKRGLLLALLERGKYERSDPEALVPIAFGVSRGGVNPGDFDQLMRLHGERELPFDRLPLLVLLRNPADPSSVVAVDPTKFSDAVANAALKRATIRIVDGGVWPLTLFGITGTPLTTGVRAKLPWLASPAQRAKFWEALVSQTGAPNSSVEIGMLFKRGG